MAIFPLTLLFRLIFATPNQPESLPEFFPNAKWTKDYVLRVKFSSGYDFSATTTTLLNEIDTYTLRQHVEAYVIVN